MVSQDWKKQTESSGGEMGRRHWCHGGIILDETSTGTLNLAQAQVYIPSNDYDVQPLSSNSGNV